MAANANELLFDAMVRHQTYLLRYSGNVRNQVNEVLDATAEALGDAIRRANTLGLTTLASARRMEKLLDQITVLREKAWGEAQTLLFQQLDDLAANEPVFFKGMLLTTSPMVLETVLPAPAQLRAIARSKPFEGALLKDWAMGLQSEDLRRIRASIQVGMTVGEGSAEIARRVVGDGGMLDSTRRQVEAIVRTAVMHVSAEARDAFAQENLDVATIERFTATLDSRTTPVCRANDGKKFKIGKGPRPPLHIACRSLRVMIFDWEPMVDRPFKPTTERILLKEYTDLRGYANVTTRDKLPRGTKGDYDRFARSRVRQLVGTVPADVTYQTWLKKQSVMFQEDVLGKTKAKLFRDGGITLDKFVARDGGELTLAQLARKHADAFRAAGLDPSGF